MPFISKDWRSPGEEWVKTQEGWEKKKVLECTAQKYPALTNFNNTGDPEHQSWSAEGSPASAVPPHCRITLKCTREIAGFTALSEAVRRLDFVSAVSDARRVHYTCALLELLLAGQRLTLLPPAAQSVLLAALEQLARHVSGSQQNLSVLRSLVQCVCGTRDSERAACWGRPLGSRALWRQHAHTIDRIAHIADNIHITQPGPEVVPKLHDLPDECIREILLRLSDYRDLESSGEAWSRMAALCDEQRTWRQLVQRHFSQLQQTSLAHQHQPLDWKTMFHQLRKKFGVREDAQYCETLSLCRHCKCLFWRSLGHPCIADQSPEYRERLKEAGGPLPPHPVPPAAFLKYFSL